MLYHYSDHESVRDWKALVMAIGLRQFRYLLCWVVALIIGNSICRAQQAKPKLVFRLALELKPETTIWEASNLLKTRLEQASPDGKIKAGEIKVMFYDRGSIGTERQLLETCFLGVVEVVQINTSVVTTIDPTYSILDLPYLFLNEAHHESVIYGPIGQRFLDRLQQHGLQGLSFYGTGFRNMFYKSNKAVERPEDLKGLKIRVMESPVMIRSINAMGASATPIPFSELFQAMKTGVVDGAENSAKVFISSKYEETGCNHFTLTEHFANQHLIIATNDWLKSLEPKYRDRIVEVSQNARKEFNTLWDSNVTEARQQITAAGIGINSIPDKSLFVESVKDISSDFFKSNPKLSRDLYDQILRAAKDNQ